MKTSKSAIFLFELMVIILVFTLAAAICSQIFAGAFRMSTESRDTTMSAINAQTVAEYFKAGNTDTEPLYFDKEWTETDSADAYYSVKLDELPSDAQMRDAYVYVYRQGSEEAIYTLHVKEFTG